MQVKTLNKYGKYSVPELQKKATAAFNEYIRLRDQANGMFTCISCGQVKSIEQLNAGHYLNAGQHTAVRYHEDNVHGQCIKCNMHMHGNLLDYRKGLIKKIGLENVEFLEATGRRIAKHDRYTLVDVIETYKQKSKQLKSERK